MTLTIFGEKWEIKVIRQKNGSKKLVADCSRENVIFLREVWKVFLEVKNIFKFFGACA